MNGHIIEGTSICVDYWLWTPPEKKYLHFLTHLHADHTYNLKTTFSEVIYTSPFNAWLLLRWFKIDPSLVAILTVHDSHVIYDETTHTHFSVTLIDANHCPGSVMFLFQGKFGNIIYTGDFRYNPDILEHPMLKSVIENEVVHRLYLDNTFAAEHCEFPPRKEALKEVINVIRNHPSHYIVIGIRKLGKEEVLQAIASEFKEKILVSNDRLKILRYLHCGHLFTTDHYEARIAVKEIHHINSSYIHKLQGEKGPVLTILLTAINSIIPPGEKHEHNKLKNMTGVLRIPYSDHSCHSELIEFVSKVKPHTIYPIVCSNKGNKKCIVDNQDPYNVSDFIPSRGNWTISEIPESILKFCKNPSVIENASCEVPVMEKDNLITSISAGFNEIITDESSSRLPELMFKRRKRKRWQDCDEAVIERNTNKIDTYGDLNDKYSANQLSEDEYVAISDEDLTQIGTDINHTIYKINHSNSNIIGENEKLSLQIKKNERLNKNDLTFDIDNAEYDTNSDKRLTHMFEDESAFNLSRQEIIKEMEKISPISPIKKNICVSKSKVMLSTPTKSEKHVDFKMTPQTSFPVQRVESPVLVESKLVDQNENHNEENLMGNQTNKAKADSSSEKLLFELKLTEKFGHLAANPYESFSDSDCFSNELLSATRKFVHSLKTSVMEHKENSCQPLCSVDRYSEIETQSKQKNLCVFNQPDSSTSQNKCMNSVGTQTELHILEQPVPIPGVSPYKRDPKNPWAVYDLESIFAHLDKIELHKSK